MSSISSSSHFNIAESFLLLFIIHVFSYDCIYFRGFETVINIDSLHLISKSPQLLRLGQTTAKGQVHISVEWTQLFELLPRIHPQMHMNGKIESGEDIALDPGSLYMWCEHTTLHQNHRMVAHPRYSFFYCSCSQSFAKTLFIPLIPYIVLD